LPSGKYNITVMRGCDSSGAGEKIGISRIQYLRTVRGMCSVIIHNILSLHLNDCAKSRAFCFHHRYAIVVANSFSAVLLKFWEPHRKHGRRSVTMVANISSTVAKTIDTTTAHNSDRCSFYDIILRYITLYEREILFWKR